MKAAQKVAQSAGVAPISEEWKPAVGNAVHYAFGAAPGAFYGVAAEYMPRITTAHGSAYGIGSMLLFDDAAVPAAELGSPATESSRSSNANSGASHLVYGGALETVRLLVRSVT